MVEKYIAQIEAEIRKKKFGSAPRSLYEPIRYILTLGGKRIRPLLTLLSYSVYRADAERVVPYAVAIEMFHNFTLMHDDIMDQAPLRRGKATVHQKWSVSTAILSGDVMLVKVYEQFLGLEENKLKQVLSRFNQCAAEVCEGQQWDMEFETASKISERQYINMIRQKTAVLLGFSLELGAILAEAPVADQHLLRDFGINIGIGFQLKDDLLDVYADQKKFGKQVGGDILANKKTFLLTQAMKKAHGKQKEKLHKLISAKKFKPSEKIKAVREIYDDLKIREVTTERMNDYFNKGFALLAQLSQKEKANTLREFTKNLIDRQS
ncbi:MAG: polyprenyl synthetase family protein [Bacteroidetes bacterium]|nr:polyprenyl synthetase family protein [Bacteroidota bacterium]MBS1540614.1 polyprenyl synthetase family protein [Bacteroidota bacterium]